jgi:hypothetical protein
MGERHLDFVPAGNRRKYGVRHQVWPSAILNGS